MMPEKYWGTQMIGEDVGKEGKSFVRKQLIGSPPARALNLDSDVEVSMNPGYHQPDVSFSDISSDSVIGTRSIRPIASLPIRARRLKTPPDSVDGYSEDETEISGKAKTKTREGGSDVESQQHEKVSMRERENLKGGKSDQSRERGDREKKGKLSKNKAEKVSRGEKDSEADYSPRKRQLYPLLGLNASLQYLSAIIIIDEY